MSGAPSSGRWTAVRVRPSSPEHGAAVSTALFAVGAQGIHEDGSDLVTQFEHAHEVDAAREAVRVADAGSEVTTAAVPDTDWSLAWRASIRSHRLGDLVVTPPWEADAHDPARRIVIEPGMAFGTGEHATTRGVVRLMQGVLREGDTVADLGAGSAVLAIAAARLGARRAIAIEMDPEAIPNAEENVVANGVGDVVTVIEGDATILLPLVAPVRVVLANIISSVLVGLLPTIEAALAPDGAAILSGILQEERAGMLAVLDEGGWRVLAEDAEDVWWSALIARR